MLLDTLGASLLGNLLTGKGVKRPKYSNIHGWGLWRAGEGTINVGEGALAAGQDC